MGNDDNTVTPSLLSFLVICLKWRWMTTSIIGVRLYCNNASHVMIATTHNECKSYLVLEKQFHLFERKTAAFSFCLLIVWLQNWWYVGEHLRINSCRGHGNSCWVFWRQLVLYGGPLLLSADLGRLVLRITAALRVWTVVEMEMLVVVAFSNQRHLGHLFVAGWRWWRTTIVLRHLVWN